MDLFKQFIEAARATWEAEASEGTVQAVVAAYDDDGLPLAFIRVKPFGDRDEKHRAFGQAFGLAAVTEWTAIGVATDAMVRAVRDATPEERERIEREGVLEDPLARDCVAILWKRRGDAPVGESLPYHLDDQGRLVWDPDDEDTEALRDTMARGARSGMLPAMLDHAETVRVAGVRRRVVLAALLTRVGHSVALGLDAAKVSAEDQAWIEKFDPSNDETLLRAAMEVDLDD